jgi:hypothetical protein
VCCPSIAWGQSKPQRSFRSVLEDGKELEELAEHSRGSTHSGTPTPEALAALMVGFALSHDITEPLAAQM